MEYQNGADVGHNIAADSGASDTTTTTNGNKRKRKQIDDGCNIENQQPSKRANHRNENGVQSQNSHHQSATSTSSSHPATAATASSSSSSACGVSGGTIQSVPEHLTAAAQLSANAAADQQAAIVTELHNSHHPPTTTDSDSKAHNQSSTSAQPESNDGLAKRQRKQKSPASKTRDKQRAKERAEERIRERQECVIMDEVPPCAGTAVYFADHEDHEEQPEAVRSPAAPLVVTINSYGVDASKPADLRLCPLPALAWAEAADVWRLMCRKDEKALLDRDPAMLERHPGIQARMRAILLDWLMEVCEVYKLHRETYYLAVDYLDRYLTANLRLPKTRLQLIGITCLFTAAKVEEIYPPKIAEFAYVTDGACTEDDIVKQELMLMLGLNWTINPVTIVGWLSVYMQLNCSNRTPASLNKLVSCDAVNDDQQHRNGKRSATTRISGASFVYPQFSAMEFVLATRILDLCTMDVEMAHFQYSVVAAAVLALTINRTTALRVSGLDWYVVRPCVKWMEPFYEVVKADSSNMFLAELDEQLQPSFGLRHISTEINTDDSYVIQTHTTSVALFEEALKNREAKIAQAIRTNKKIAAAEALKKQQCTPAAQTTSALAGDLMSPGGPLTPPDSNRKSNSGISSTPAIVIGVNSVLATVSMSGNSSNTSTNSTVSNTPETLSLSTLHSSSGSSTNSSSALSGATNDVDAPALF